MSVVTHFLDSNVLVYAFSRSPRDATKARIARQWIAREDWGVTVQVLQEFYVNAVRTPHELGHDDAVAMIEEIAHSRPVGVVDVPLLRHALRLKSRYGIAYWDAAVIAGAFRLGADILVSEDLSDGQDYGGVRVFNPFSSA
jgi:predicted nucleic acid-binding protein